MFGIVKVTSRFKLNSLKKSCVSINSCFISVSSRASSCKENSSQDSHSYVGIKKNQYDIAVVGAGIIGLGTALELKQRFPCYSICVVDKEPYVAFHQSGRNSGVIHAGIYYKPGSLRAKLCVEGMHMMYDFCEKHNIKHKRNGKLIIAVNQQETVWLRDLYKIGTENKVPDLKLLDPDEFREIEPYMTGLQALHSPYTGIVEFADVTREYAKIFRRLGGNIFLNFKVAGFCESVEGDGSTKGSTSAYPMTIVADDNRTIKAGYVVTCGGLHADTLAMMTGESPYPKIMPFRGVYFLMNPEKNCQVNGNVYPVPDPSMPFIGVHFTPKVDGSVWLGPTAMLAYKKEGYSWTDIDFGDIMGMLKFEGLYRFFLKHPRSCIYEIQRSFSASTLLKELQQFMPTLRLQDMTPDAAVGVQAQAMNKDGTFSEDFGFSSNKGRILHCRNAPSPAATSSLAIAKYVASEVEKRL